MAFKPSLRRHHKSESTELNLTPIMNLMVVMIPLLLTNAQFIKIGVIELNLPPSAGAAGLASEGPKEHVRTLDLTVSVTDQGFYISSASTVLDSESGTGPTIPVNANGEYDFSVLSKKLLEIKQTLGKEFSDNESIVIQAENQISYQVLVATMDAARAVRVDGKLLKLFPNVALSAGVI